MGRSLLRNLCYRSNSLWRMVTRGPQAAKARVLGFLSSGDFRVWEDPKSAQVCGVGLGFRSEDDVASF